MAVVTFKTTTATINLHKFQVKTVGFAHTHFFFEKKKQKTLIFLT